MNIKYDNEYQFHRKHITLQKGFKHPRGSCGRPPATACRRRRRRRRRRWPRGCSRRGRVVVEDLPRDDAAGVARAVGGTGTARRVHGADAVEVRLARRRGRVGEPGRIRGGVEHAVHRREVGAAAALDGEGCLVGRAVEPAERDARVGRQRRDRGGRAGGGGLLPRHFQPARGGGRVAEAVYTSRPFPSARAAVKYSVSPTATAVRFVEAGTPSMRVT